MQQQPKIYLYPLHLTAGGLKIVCLFSATMASAPLMLSPRLLPLPTEADMATVDTEVAEADMATMASALLRLSLWQKLKLILSFTTTALMDIMGERHSKKKTEGGQMLQQPNYTFISCTCLLADLK